jgi:hypothetical protein
LHPLSLCFILISALIFARFELAKKTIFNFKSIEFFVLFSICIVVSYITTLVWFIPSGATHDFPVYIYNTVSVLCQVGAYFLLPFYLVKQFSFKFPLPFRNAGELCVSLSLLLLLVFSSNNISLIKSNFDKGYLQDLKNKTDKFYSDVAIAKKSGAEHTVVYFQNPQVIPASVFIKYDVLPNRASACWNIAYEDYFGIDEVRLAEDTIFK